MRWKTMTTPKTEAQVEYQGLSQAESFLISQLTSNSNALLRGGKMGAPEPIAALNRVKIEEKRLVWKLHEPLVDIRTFCPEVEIATERVCPFMRLRAAEMLNLAQSLLPQGFKLKIGTALRTLTMQKSGWDGFFDKQKQEHPDWPLSALRRATNKFYAPYDQFAPPGHATGGAVDVALIAPDGSQLDLIEPTTGWEAAYTWSDKISIESKRNRMMMVEAMLKAGFSNCRDEYWHYSFGDSAWAVRVGEKKCSYGWAHPPVCLETTFPNGSAENCAADSTRDEKTGRVLSAKGGCSLIRDTPNDETGAPYFRVGIFWAKEIPVHLTLKWNESIAPPKLYVGDNLNEWAPISEFERVGAELILQLTPQSDRVYLSTLPREYLVPSNPGGDQYETA